MLTTFHTFCVCVCTCEQIPKRFTTLYIFLVVLHHDLFVVIVSWIEAEDAFKAERSGGFNYFCVNIISQLFNIKRQALGFMVDLCTQIKASFISFHSFLATDYSDDRLSLAEFTLICRALFRNDKGHIYIVPADKLEQMFAVFDKNQDGEYKI